MLTKVVDGVRMNLTPEEEAETLAKWATEVLKIETAESVRQEKILVRQSLLSRLGLTNEEAELLVKISL